VEHIGHTGHSFGAFTAHALGGANFSPTMGIRNFRDPRVDAIVPVSPQGYHRFGSYDEGPENNSWSDIRIPVYLICGELENPPWRRQPFDRYPLVGDKYFTIGKGHGHAIINADAATKRLLALNTALFFHTYLRGAKAAIKSARWPGSRAGRLSGRFRKEHPVRRNFSDDSHDSNTSPLHSSPLCARCLCGSNPRPNYSSRPLQTARQKQRWHADAK
ncbi:MAG: hypothetical protein HC841_08870, partial [Verrucomicrobiae bacterium]|nr:hypothetical protein [Verrucomicrobiae bacterium]